MNTSMRIPWLQGLIAAGLLAGGLAGTTCAADARIGPDLKDLQATRDKAADYLRKHQSEDGSFSSKLAGPGVTALVVAAMLRNGYSADDPMLARAVAYLEKKVQKDGGIYEKQLANYTTCVALLAFQEANKSGKYDTLIKNAVQFLKGLQVDDSKADKSDPRLGGVGYDGQKRPDLSNTTYLLDSLQAAGVPRDDPAVKRALIFISRSQNLPGEHNDLPFAKKVSVDDRGGLTYAPLDTDDSPHKTAEGGLRSVGSMTYAGLKSFLYAGVTKDDPRVKAAIDWIRRHYVLTENPGRGQAGLFYYYHTFAKAMAALGDNYFEDAAGKKHDWRRELFETLKNKQRQDGSWINDKSKEFGETDPNLATAFSLLTLSYCQPPKP